MRRKSITPLVVTTLLAALASPSEGAVPNGVASCYSSLLSGPPSTLSAYVQSVNNDGAVVVNGGDTQQPTITPFQFAWGDGSTTSGWFPQTHLYANAGQNYVITITATENNGATQQASAVVFFLPPAITPQVLSGVSFQIPSASVQFQAHWPAYAPPTDVTYFGDSSFPIYTRSDVAYILAAVSSIDYNLANSNSFLLNGIFSIDMLEATDFDGGVSYWYTTPMSVGYSTDVTDPPMWYILFNEIGKDTTLNTPVNFSYGGNTDGSASEIYSETMGDIFSYASGCQLISNAAAYGLGPDVTADVTNSMLSGAANLQGQYNAYIAAGAPFSSWNPYNGGTDPTLGTVATLAWIFIEQAEMHGQGYQIPTNRLMTFLQQFNATLLASYAPTSNTSAAATFRSTLMVAALSYAFSEDLRSRFESLNFPIDNGIFDQLFEGITGGGASLAPPAGAFAAQAVGTTSSGQAFTLTNYLLTPLILSASFSGANQKDFPIQASSTCPYPTGTLAANSSCTYVIAFAPSVDGAEGATFSVADTDGTQALASSPQSVGLTGTGVAPSVSLSTTSLTFSAQRVSTVSAPQAVTLTNNGTGTLNVTSIALTIGAFAETNNCGSSVAAGANCTVSVTFDPTAAGTFTGTLTITDNNDGVAGSTETVSLTGTGTEPVVGLSPASLTFAAQLSGTSSAAQTVTLNNTGNASLTVSGITASGDFAETNTCSSNVNAGANCTISVTFKPTAAGTRTGSITISDNAAGSPQSVGLSGTGEDFTLAAASGSATTATVAPGSPASYTLSVTGEGGFNQSVSLACSGAPSEATCTVSPSPVTAASSATNVTVTVTTTAPSISAPRSRHIPTIPPLARGLRGLLMLAMALVVMAWAIVRRKPCGMARWQSTMLPLATGLLLTLALAGCGGGGGGGGGTTPNPGTPAGTYTLTVTGTAGSGSTALSHNVTLTLTVS